MKKCGKKTKKFVAFFVSMMLVISVFCVSAYGHSGRTDSNGGHTDHSTGEYHYHHGMHAHQHENGVCPYAETETTSSSDDFDYSSESKTIYYNPRTYEYKTVEDARELLLNDDDDEEETSNRLSSDAIALIVVFVVVGIAIIVFIKKD